MVAKPAMITMSILPRGVNEVYGLVADRGVSLASRVLFGGFAAGTMSVEGFAVDMFCIYFSLRGKQRTKQLLLVTI
jgi:hypothetical protein